MTMICIKCQRKRSVVPGEIFKICAECLDDELEVQTGCRFGESRCQGWLHPDCGAHRKFRPPTINDTLRFKDA